MGSNRPTRNHYIPELLLHNFCDDDGFLWAGDKSGRQAFHPPPSKLFVETNLYATIGYDKSVKTFENENALSKIESDAEHAISAIIEKARRDVSLNSPEEDNDRFKRFIVAQARRTPESQEGIGIHKAVDYIFPEAVSMIKEKLGYTLVDDDCMKRVPCWTSSRDTAQTCPAIMLPVHILCLNRLQGSIAATRDGS